MATGTTQVILAEALQFFQDLPFAQIGTAVASGGTNIMVDISAFENIIAAGLKDFLGGAAPASAPATTAAISAAASSSTAPVLKSS